MILYNKFEILVRPFKIFSVLAFENWNSFCNYQCIKVLCLIIDRLIITDSYDEINWPANFKFGSLKLMYDRWHTTTTLTKCVNINKVCCCMVFWVLFRVPTTHFNNVLLYGVVGNNTHNTIQQHTLLMLLLCVTYEPSY